MKLQPYANGEIAMNHWRLGIQLWIDADKHNMAPRGAGLDVYLGPLAIYAGAMVDERCMSFRDYGMTADGVEILPGDAGDK